MNDNFWQTNGKRNRRAVIGCSRVKSKMIGRNANGTDVDKISATEFRFVFKWIISRYFAHFTHTRKLLT